MQLLYILILLSFSYNVSLAVNWQEVDVPKSEYVRCWTQKGDDVLLGGVGIRVSHDGGKTFEYSNKMNNLVIDGTDIQNNILEISELYITNSGNYLAGLSSAPCLISTDKGNSWDTLDISFFSYDIEFYENETGIYLVYGRGMYRSIDNGLTWGQVFFRDSDFLFDGFDFTTDGKILMHVQNHLMKNSSVYIYDTKSSTIDSVISTKQLGPAYLYGDQLFEYYTPYQNEIDTLWKSSDYGGTWTFSSNIKEEILSQIEQKNTEITIRTIDAKDDILVCLYKTKHGDSTNKRNFAYSLDNGKGWHKIDISKLPFPQYTSATIKDGNIFIRSLRSYKYDLENQKLESAEFNFPVTNMLRKLDNLEYAYSNYSSSLQRVIFWKKTDQDWDIQATTETDEQYISLTGEIFTVENKILLRKFKSNLDTIAINQGKSFKVLRQYDDGSLLILIDSENNEFNSSVILVKKDQTDLLLENAEYDTDYDIASATYYYVKSHFNNTIMYTGNKSNGLVDSLELNLTDSDYNLNEFSRQGDKLIFRANNSTSYSIYTSTDGGLNLVRLEESDELFAKRKPIVYHNEFYTLSNMGIFHSVDGITWENLLEEKFNGNVGVVNYEFDLEGYIYAYTNMGTFKSTAPVSVTEDESKSNTPNISINIYPNPSSDILNFDFNGQVEKKAVVDLNGNIISCPQTLNSLDISNLSSGAYFLKITSNGKTYYRQFVKAE